MHIQAMQFMQFMKGKFPEQFQNKIVFDVGSGDINGNNRYLFENCNYAGNDVMKAPNVDYVCRTKDLPFDNHFDTIVSTECFEHDAEYAQSFLKIHKMLKKEGMFIFTCASTGRREHGTRRTSPQDSYGTICKLEDMQDYYKNLTIEDVNEAMNLDEHFVQWETAYNPASCDLYFYGIKA